MNSHKSWILISVVLAACAQTQPTDGAPPETSREERVTCAESDLAARSAMPPGTRCRGHEHVLPDDREAHTLRISHWRNPVPFSAVEDEFRGRGIDPEGWDVKYWNAAMNVLVRIYVARMQEKFESNDFKFRWLDGSERWLLEKSKPFPPTYMPRAYPPGSCVHAKF